MAQPTAQVFQRLMTEMHSAALLDTFLAADNCYYFDKRNYPGWHLGRQRYYVWLISIELPEVLQRLTQLRDNLQSFLLKPYQRQAHVSVFVPGFMSRDEAQCQRDIAKQVLAVESLRINAFDIQVAGANSFLASPFLSVHNPSGELTVLRDCLGEQCDENMPPAQYHPHITAGVYSQAFNCRYIFDAFFNLCDTPEIAVGVNAIDLCWYDSSDIASKLQLLHRVCLPSRVLSL